MTATTPALPCRYPLVDPATATDPIVRATFDAIERELGFGMVPNLFRALGTQPLVLQASWELFRAVVLTGELPRIVKELVGIVVSAANASQYAMQVHMHSLGVQGVESAVLKSVAAGDAQAADLAPSVKALLLLANNVAQHGPHVVADSDIANVYTLGVTPAELAEIFAAIDLFQYVNSLTDLYRVPVDAL